MTITILLIVAILILAVGIIIIGAMLIKRQKENDILFKEMVESTIKSSTKNADAINMRLIALATEVILNAPAMTQYQVDDFEEDLKERDKTIVDKILGDEQNENFDPFKEAERVKNQRANQEPEDTDGPFSTVEIVAEKSAVYNQGKEEGK